jgi:hypothetical protein
MSEQRPLSDAEYAILRNLSAELQAVSAKVDASRAEGTTRGLEQAAVNRRIEADLGSLRTEVRNQGTRLATVESEVRDLRNEDAEVKRSVSESDLAQEAALGGAIAHVRTLDHEMSQMREQLAAGGRVDHAICSVLGVDYHAIATPPGKDESPEDVAQRTRKAKPKTDFVQLARENKVGTWAATLAFLTAAIELAIKILH